MKILVTNDDGPLFKGLQCLLEVARNMGELVVIPPKYHQSGASMSVPLGYKPVAVKKLEEKPGEQWWYLDATPASCVKWALDEIYKEDAPDLLLSGVNHGSNAGSAELYSGTLGAVKEGTLAGVLSVGVSLCSMSQNADFSAVSALLPGILDKIIRNHSGKFGVYYNINFPDLPLDKIKGVRLASQGIMHWINEFVPYQYDILEKNGKLADVLGIRSFPPVEEGEKVYMMAGDLVTDKRNTPDTDWELLAQGYVTVTIQNIDTTDYQELTRLKEVWR